MSRVRSLLLVPLLCLVWWACSEGTGPENERGTVGLGIVPSFQVDPALFPTNPVDRIRLTAYDAATDSVVGTFDESVSPTASQWVLALPIDLGGAATLDVIVEAELFAGTAVVWSGRMGPTTVPTSAPALSMDIYRGSLDNLDVTAVGIVSPPAVMVEGTSLDVTATVTLAPGSTVTPVVYWASSDTSVFTVADSGTTATVTAVAPGTANLIASSGAAYDEVPIPVVALGTATKTWTGGDATNPTLWSDPDNWMPAGVPGPGDVVLVPATANDPQVDASVTLTGLTVSTGASVDLMQQAFEVTGNLTVDGTLANGEVVVSGPGSFLEGTVDRLRVSSDRVVSSTLYLNGDLTLEATLSVGREAIYVAGTLTTTGVGALGMTTTGGYVTTAGATFSGGSEDGLLTAGELYVSGDFVASGDSLAFAAGPSHTVVLNGTATQTLDFQSAGPSAGRFGTLLVQNATGVDLAGDAYASAVTVSGLLTVAAGRTFDISGALTLASGATLAVDGTVTAASCVDNGAIIVGTGTHPCGSGQQFTKVWVGGDVNGATDWSLPGNWNPPGTPGAGDTVLVNTLTNDPVLSSTAIVGAITVGNTSSVNLNSLTLQVNSDVSAGTSGFSNGNVVIAGPGTVLQGNFDGLQVSVGRALSGPTWVNGAFQTSGDLDVAGHSLLTYGALSVTGANGRLTMNDPSDAVYVGLDATFDGGDHDGALSAGYLSLDGNLTVISSSVTGFVGSGTHVTSFDGIALQTVTFSAPASDQQRFNDVWITNNNGVFFETSAFVSGDLDLSGRIEIPGGTTVEVAGDVTLGNASELHVDGTLIVGGTCTDQGALITGTGTQPCGAPASADYTWVGGASPNANDWDDPNNWSPVGVPGPTDAVLVQGASYDVTLSSDVAVGSIDVGGFNYVFLNGHTIAVAGDVIADGGGLSSGTVIATGAGMLQGSFGTTLEVQGNRTLTGATYVYGTLITSADVDVNGQYLQVDADLMVTGANGRLVMTVPSAGVYVYGNATFDGADHTGAMTDGSLQFSGNLDVPASSPLGFVSSGNHVVNFTGNTSQTVTFGAPGLSQQHLNNVYTYTPYALSFPNGASVAGTMNVAAHWLVPAGTSVDISGTLNLYGASTFEVHGDVTAAACNVTTGALILGSGSQPCGPPVSADRVWLGGDPMAPNDWGTGSNWSPAGAPQANEIVVVPSREYLPILSINAAVSSLTVGPNASLDLGANTIDVSLDVRADGSITNGLLQIIDNVGGSTISGYVDDLRIAGTGVRTLSNTLIVYGDFGLEAPLEMSQYGLTVYGNLDVTTASGGIRMSDPAATVVVSGNTTFDGGSSTPYLSQGSFYLYGDLTVLQNNVPDAFHMSGGLLYLLGSNQFVDFSNPVVDGQRLHNLSLSGGAKTFGTPVFVDGTLNAASVTLYGEAGFSTLRVEGASALVQLNTVTFDGLNLELVTGQDTDQAHLLNKVTFANQDAGVSQLFLQMPMGVNALAIDAPVFSTVPSSGNYIEAIGTGGVALQIQVTSPTPANHAGHIKTSNAVINGWPM